LDLSVKSCDESDYLLSDLRPEIATHVEDETATSLTASEVPDESGMAGLSCASSAFSLLRTMKEKEEANHSLSRGSNAVIFLQFNLVV